MSIVTLIVGGNIGNRASYIENAKQGILLGIGTIIRESSIYETSPWGFKSSNLFLNQVLIVETDLDPTQTLLKINMIEQSNGRIRTKPAYESRTLDIDILFFDDLIIETSQLKIPHPSLAERLFVLKPLAELMPDFVHPVLGQTIINLLTSCPDKNIVNKFTPYK